MNERLLPSKESSGLAWLSEKSTWFGVAQPLKYDRWSVIRVLYALSTMIVTFVFVRLWGQVMPTHSFFYSMSWAFGFSLLFAVRFAYVRLWAGVEAVELDGFWPTAKQSSVIGLSYTINYLGVSCASPHVSGPAQVVASVLPIAFSGIVSFFAFRRRYPGLAWLGVALTVAGGAFQMATTPATTSFQVSWFLLFALGNLPSAVWTVTLEGFFKAQGSDGKACTMSQRLMFTNLALIVWLLIFVPLFGALGQPPLANFYDDFATAVTCVTTGAGGYEGDHCVTASWLLPVTIVVAALQMHSQTLLSKYETGMLATLVMNLAPFFADPIFMSKAIMTTAYFADPSTGDIGASVFCCVGALLFAIFDSRRPAADTQREVDESRLIKWSISRGLRAQSSGDERGPINEMS